MDRRLFHAAQTGNEGELLQLIEENPLILSALSLSSADTPLHIASLAGHFSFAKQIICLKPEFAKEFNQDGFSPMHMASANGHVDIVRELVKVDPGLCRLKGRDGKTPLHIAAIKGRVDVIKELFNACVESVGEVTVRGETVFHLAVKNHQFQAFRILVEMVKQHNKEDVLNRKDERGNTVLHLATYEKQREVVELLVRRDRENANAMELNAINESGVTALDILLMFPSEAGDREIDEILRNAGAIRAQGATISSSPTSITNNNSSSQEYSSQSLLFRIIRWFKFSRKRDSLCPMDRLEQYFRFQKGRDSPTHARNILLVIAILIATATYQAGLSPPGGVWQDDNSNFSKTHHAGESILGSSSLVSFSFFAFFNSVGLHVSLFMLNILTHGFPLRLELQISIAAMMFTYYTALNTVVPHGIMNVFLPAISIFVPLTIPVIIRWVRKRLELLRQPIVNLNDSSA